jgi:hypothetical protein
VPVESLGAQPAYVPGEFNGLQVKKRQSILSACLAVVQRLGFGGGVLDGFAGALTVWERAKKHSVNIHPDVGLYIAKFFVVFLGLMAWRAYLRHCREIRVSSTSEPRKIEEKAKRISSAFPPLLADTGRSCVLLGQSGRCQSQCRRRALQRL